MVAKSERDLMGPQPEITLVQTSEEKDEKISKPTDRAKTTNH